MPGADIGTKRALGGRLRSAAEVEDGAGKLFRSFLWRIVPDVFEYAALVVAGKETLVSLRFLRRVHLVIGAMNYNRRDADLGQGCQLRLDGCIARIACGITNAMSVGVDHYVHAPLAIDCLKCGHCISVSLGKAHVLRLAAEYFAGHLEQAAGV